MCRALDVLGTAYRLEGEAAMALPSLLAHCYNLTLALVREGQEQVHLDPVLATSLASHLDLGEVVARPAGLKERALLRAEALGEGEVRGVHRIIQGYQKK